MGDSGLGTQVQVAGGASEKKAEWYAVKKEKLNPVKKEIKTNPVIHANKHSTNKGKKRKIKCGRDAGGQRRGEEKGFILLLFN